MLKIRKYTFNVFVAEVQISFPAVSIESCNSSISLICNYLIFIVKVTSHLLNMDSFFFFIDFTI